MISATYVWAQKKKVDLSNTPLRGEGETGRDGGAVVFVVVALPSVIREPACPCHTGEMRCSTVECQHRRAKKQNPTIAGKTYGHFDNDHVFSFRKVSGCYNPEVV